MAKKQTETKVVREGSLPDINKEQKIKAGIETPIEEIKKEEVKEEKKEIKTETTKEKKVEENKSEDKKTDEKKEKSETKKPQKKIKKSEVTVNVTGIPISKKTSMAISRMIKYKALDQAIEELEQVVKKKKVVPMRGEIPHKKGKGIMSGRYPKEAATEFIVLLKSLKANADNHDVDEPILVEAVINKGFLPFGRGGRVKHKRANIYLRAVERKSLKLNKNKTKK